MIACGDWRKRWRRRARNRSRDFPSQATRRALSRNREFVLGDGSLPCKADSLRTCAACRANSLLHRLQAQVASVAANMLAETPPPSLSACRRQVGSSAASNARRIPEEPRRGRVLQRKTDPKGLLGESAASLAPTKKNRPSDGFLGCYGGGGGSLPPPPSARLPFDSIGLPPWCGLRNGPQLGCEYGVILALPAEYGRSSSPALTFFTSLSFVWLVAPGLRRSSGF
ncbi:MAG: hypothetical protein JWQ01_2368 [Massilia sp.]|nr:hypothetical protein [Massilia sp.]